MKKSVVWLTFLLSGTFLCAMDKSIAVLPVGKAPSKEHQLNYALLLAAQKGNCVQIAQLLTLGADVNTRHIDGVTPLFLAAQNNHCDAMQMLINACADLNLKHVNGVSIFRNVAIKGLQGPVDVLLKAGIPPKGEEALFALRAAAAKNHVHVAELLIKAGTPVNRSNDREIPPLTFAVREGNKEIVRLLVQAKADVSAKNEEGLDALFYACVAGHVEIAALLLQAGATPKTKDPVTKGSLLHFVASLSDKPSLMRLLINAGCDINEADPNTGATPLMVAAHAGNYCCVETLLNLKAEVNARSYAGGSALQAAVQAGHDLIVELLLKNGADIHAVDQLNTGLVSLAAARGHMHIVRRLLNAGASIKEKNCFGGNALWSAAARDDDAMIKSLLKAGARPEELPAALTDDEMRQKVAEQEQKLKCARCGITKDTKYCSRCKGIRYCSKKCQEAHWAQHNKECKIPSP